MIAAKAIVIFRAIARRGNRYLARGRRPARPYRMVQPGMIVKKPKAREGNPSGAPPRLHLSERTVAQLRRMIARERLVIAQCMSLVIVNEQRPHIALKHRGVSDKFPRWSQPVLRGRWKRLHEDVAPA